MYADTAHRANPEDAPLLLGDFARRLGFGSIALPAFVLLRPCLRNHEGAVFELTDGIGKVDMCIAIKQVVDGERDWQGGSDLVGRSKGGANISASIPGNLRMIFEVQQEPFFHLATERLAACSTVSCFPARNPARDALSSNFEQVDATHSSFRHDLASQISSTNSLWRISIPS